jgi:K+-sensing histidine kinase KdpD
MINGPGLPHAGWQIFEPYQRAHDAATQPASIGLGLTKARQLAHLMGGDLGYTVDDTGSSFLQNRSWSLPMTDQLAEAALAQPA